MFRQISLLAAASVSLNAASLAADFTSSPLEAVTSWIGNSYGGASKWVQQDIHGMAVTAEGTVFTNVPWDEAGGNGGEYRDGELIRYAGHTHGWGYQGGEAVGFNAKYLFFGIVVGNEDGKLADAETWPPKGCSWLGISRRERGDISKPAPFAGGKGGKGDTLRGACLVVAEVPDKEAGTLAGICADEARLYVADSYSSQIKVYDAETMMPVAAWKIERAGPLALDAAGVLWMLQRKSDSAPARLVRFNPKGEEIAPAMVFAPEVSPVSFCFSRDGRVLVADDGPAQQVRLFMEGGGTWKESGTFGERGGIGSDPPGTFGDRRFNRLTAIGCDRYDNLYVAQDGQSGGGGTVLESYRLGDGALNWRLLGLTFVDMADVEPGHDAEVYTKEEHFHLDYTKPAGKEAAYAAFTISREKYPQDPRLHLWSAGAWVRRIGERRILFVNEMNADHLQVYRFASDPEGEVAIPSGFFAKGHMKEKEGWPPHQPEKGAWIWRDQNGNGAFEPEEFASGGPADLPASQGWWVDQAGNVWLATEKEGLRLFPLQGLDAQGNPGWDFKTMQTFPPPEGFREVKRIRYDAVGDTLYLGGTTEEDRNQHWKPMGPVLARYDGWLRGDRKLRWRKTLPYAHGAAGHESCEPMGFDVAGDFVFVPYTGASKAAGVKTGRVEVFRVADGSAVGHMEPGAEIGEVGLQDLRETLTAHRRDDGEYVVLLEDDWKAKVLMYRIRNLFPKREEP